MGKFVHLHGHTEYSLLDGLSKIKKLVKAAKSMDMDSIAITDHGAMYGAIEFYKEALKEGIKPIIGCLPPGQIIYTKDGIKSIEEVKAGDLVLTHKGRFKKVLDTMRREFKGNIYGIKATHANTVWVTGEHPILTTDSELKKVEWVRADKLGYGRKNKHGGIKSWRNYAVFPKLKEETLDEIKTLDYLNQSIYGENKGIIDKVNKYNKYDSLKSTNLPSLLNINNERARFFGLFLAEGSFSHDSKGRATAMNFSFGGDENMLAQFVANELILNYPKNKTTIDNRPNKNIQEVHHYNAVLAQFMANLTKEGAGNKRIPPPMFSWSKENLEKLLEGIVDGDGYIDKNYQIRVKVKSRDLAYGIRLIVAALGYSGRITKIQKGKKVSFQVTWSPKSAYKRALEDNNYLFYPIRDIEQKYYEGLVYNFSVEDDNSYVSEITLHNCELYVAKRSHKDKEGKIDTEPYHLTILAKDYQGYQNLMKLVTIAHLDGYYYKPRVDKELLKQFHQGLIALSGCPAGEFIRSLKEENIGEAKKVAETYLDIFGEGNYYFELQNHEYTKLLKNTNLDPKVKADLEHMEKVQTLSWATVKDLSQKMGVKIVATNDFHYVSADDANAQDAVVCVQTGKQIRDLDRLRMIDTPNLYIKSQTEMEELFSDLPEAIGTTGDLAKDINLEITLGKAYFPIFDIPQGLTPIDYLTKHCYEGFEKKFKEDHPRHQEMKDRLDYELMVIDKKNYATYFLIVADFMNWANDHGIITNTRGSAAGSFVLFCLGITLVDPIEFMLPFERFLNLDRPSLPDIDSDIADDRRSEVIQYVKEKYGEDKVSQIVTFGTMMGRAAVRDIGRVLGMAYADVDRIAKLVPPPHQGFHKPLEDAVKEVPELAEMYKSDPQVKHLLDLAQKVEGTVRQASVHAAGVVIAPSPLTDFSPLQRDTHGEGIVTQYDMYSVGEDGIGLVKMDFLGIRNLSILGTSVKIVKENTGIEIDLNKLPLDDPRAYQTLAQGETMGLFQIEGEGMTKYLMDLKPTNIFDIMAMIALYRPGPLAIIPEYIARKHHPSKVSFFDPRMKAYLERSLGLLVYQDDVLLTAINIAGYSWTEADKFRKAMGKKIPEEMAKQKDHFVHGCIEKGMTPEKAEELFKLIEPFAAYGFNKAHAASYAIITYWTAYMKANYPVEFVAALMSAESGDTEKIASCMEECKKLGIMVLPPDVNRSKVGFTLENISDLSEDDLKRQVTQVENPKQKQSVRFGLSAIKHVGVSAIESIIKAREKQVFKSLPDLCSRVDNRLVNRKTLESLIKAGALDSLGSRAAQLLILDQCLELAHQKNKQTSSGQVGLFGETEVENEFKIELPNVPELDLDQMLGFEKDLLGFFLHEPPFLKLLNQANQYATHKISGLLENESVIGKKVILVGIITQAKKVVTKKSAAEMAFITLSDTLGTIEGVVFPNTYIGLKNVLQTDKVVVVTGKVDMKEDKLSLVVDKALEFIPETFDPEQLNFSQTNDKYPARKVAAKSAEEDVPVRKRKEDEVEISVPMGCDVDILKQVNRTLRDYPGKYKVSLLLPNGGNNLKKMDLPFGIKMDPIMVEQVETLLGKGTVKLN